ncbi:MAG: dihydropteroate synthase [Pseudomonadota bacterium]
MSTYLRPIPQVGPARPEGALLLAGGWAWFTHVEVLQRDALSRIIDVQSVGPEGLDALVKPRSAISGLDFSAPVLMGILNTTPDSFSDGGAYVDTGDAVNHALGMARDGAHLIDVGGESTRPGAETVSVDEEIRRTQSVIAVLRDAGLGRPISIDTRKVAVAEAAIAVGADIVNDVSGFAYDPDLARLCARHGTPVCVMHAQGAPETMQDNPKYDDVLLDVYDFLDSRIAHLVEIGIPRSQIIADPGIGFGKTEAHNLALLSRFSLFHGLGVPILLGASRKGFIGRIGGARDKAARMPGSVGVGLAAVAHGAQVVRVHDVADTRQAIALWRASMAIGSP